MSIRSRRLLVTLGLALLLTILLAWRWHSTPLAASILASPISPIPPMGWIPYVPVGD